MRSTCKWVLLFGPDGWQRSDESHQWQVAKTLLCLKENQVVIPFCLISSMFFFPSSDYVTRQYCNMLLSEYNEKL